MTALSAPVLLMLVGMGIEVGHWATVKAELQRTADAAALGGSVEYAIASNPLNAANAAADVAALNGAVLDATRTWDAVNQTLTSGRVTVQVGAGVQNAQNTGIKVAVGQAVPLLLTRVMSTAPTIVIGAAGWAELSFQPCILTLGTTSAAPLLHDVSLQGNITATLVGCTMRSNAAITTGGGATATAAGFLAGAAISGGGLSGGPLYQNAGTLSDPYATYMPVQTALSKLGPPSGTTCDLSKNGPVTLSPGTWSCSWYIQNNVTLSPGIYYVNGTIDLYQQSLLSGSGVTIVSSGALTVNGGASLALSAATSTGASNGAIPGILFASPSASTSWFVGNTPPVLTGVLYQPNARMYLSATTAQCLEVIAARVDLQGNARLSANCSNYGTLAFGSDRSGASPVRLAR